MAPPLLLVCVAALCVWGTFSRADRELRTELLAQAHLVAPAINLDRILALSGSPDDENTPNYTRLKNQLAYIRMANPQFRFISLLGRRADGTIFFFLDSEPPQSELSSPPGQVYEEASLNVRRAFEARVSVVDGAMPDRWGDWVSALVPLIDPLTGNVAAVLSMDVDARDWMTHVAAKAALPTGLVLVLLIGLGTVLATLRRVDASAKPVLRRLLPSLAAIMIFLVAGAGVLLWQQHVKFLSVEASADITKLANNLKASLAQQTPGLIATAQVVAADPDTKVALRQGDTERLLSIWKPVFANLQREGRVAQLLFVDTSRACIARIHKSEVRDDQLDRYLVLEAERTRQVASGLDLNARGELVVRVVQPVLEEEAPVGYIEISRKIEDVFQELHMQSEIELGVLIRKELLNRPVWEEGMRDLGREANWDRFARSAIVYTSQERLPDPFSSWVDHIQDGRASERVPQNIEVDGSHWQASAMPLQDASGKQIGNLLILRNIDTEGVGFAHLIMIFGATSTVVLALLLGFIYMLLRRTDASIRAQQEALRESEQAYRSQFVENSSSMFLIDPADGSIVDANAAALNFYGYSREQILAMNIGDINTLPFSKIRQVMQAVHNENGKRFEFQHRLADGSLRDVEVAVTVVKFGNRTLLHSIGQDITERKRAQRALQREQLFNEALLSSLPGIFYLYAYPEGTLVRHNKNHAILLGYEEDEIEGRHMNSWHPPEAVEAVRQAIEGVMARGQGVIESPLLTKDGRQIPFLMTGIRLEVEGQTYLMGVGIDITERKRAEEMIAKRLVALTQPMDDGSISFDDLFDLNEIQRIQDEFALATGVASIITHPDGSPITAPSSFTRLCNEIIRGTEMGCANCFKSDAVIGRPHPDGPIVQPCLSGGLWDAGASIVVGNRHIANWLIGQVRDETQKEEKIRAYAREIGADETDAAKAFAEVPGMSLEQFNQVANALFTLSNQLSTTAYQNVQQARFITERTKVENALRVSEERYRALVENANSIIIRLNSEGKVTFINEFGQRYFGYAEEEIVGRHVVGTIVPESDATGRLIHELIKDIGSHPEDRRLVENENVLRDGTRVWISWTNKPIFDENGQLREILCVGIDATMRKRAEEEKAKLEGQLLQAQKMESVGRLAGGVAHDFNNMLGVILGYTELALEELGPAHPLHADLTEIRKAAERSADLTRQLLAFARKQTVSPKIINLNDAVSGMLKMLQRLIGEDIDLLWLPGENLEQVRMDPSQIDQILANLCVNARDAIADVGKVTIETENCTLDEEFCIAHVGVEPGDYVRLSVSDNGCGMSKETLSHLFEPFRSEEH
ncbi:MAG: PAS domain S-box protein, partial [FCB group bacterium]|nr:PAS domain S-box protein [FCB group bacterium]